MNDRARKPTVFISYTRPDAQWAEDLSQHLNKEGAKTWLPSRPVSPDESWATETRKGLQESEFLILILESDPDKAAPWVHFEWGAAYGAEKKGFEKRAFIVSPRGSNVDAGELPLYARALSFHQKTDAAEVARQIKTKLDELSTVA